MQWKPVQQECELGTTCPGLLLLQEKPMMKGTRDVLCLYLHSINCGPVFNLNPQFAFATQHRSHMNTVNLSVRIGSDPFVKMANSLLEHSKYSPCLGPIQNSDYRVDVHSFAQYAQYCNEAGMRKKEVNVMSDHPSLWYVCSTGWQQTDSDAELSCATVCS